ncbi:PREDICTED: uncharacterized protein LOC105960047 [Erythranthe guttata]|nr:PREDICTED: uncharacterized protein LOC105960047 [Erythranthe guttata]|eukprot:XP_012839671.1 PREDICTED: uncharacterized protein LOC105960047 [Erythranthe guttata]
MRTDGKIIEYKSPIKVHQVLSDFPNHALLVSDNLPPIVNHMHPNADLLRGRLYYLVPLPVVPQPMKKTKTKPKKTVRFAEDVVIVEEEAEEEKEKTRQSNGVTRIKLVISKKELQAILSKEGVSVEDMISHVQQNEQSTIKIECIPQVH